MPATKYVADKPILLRAKIKDAQFYRADLTFVDVDHSGPTFEGRVFLNNPGADESTPKTPDTGYAGSFYVFGHGGCFGDEGHCDVPKQQRPNDLRDPHPLVPKDFTVSITEALRRELEKGLEIQITVIPVVMAATEKCDLTNVLKFTRFEIMTYK